jgi:hypothetical protein
MTVTPFQLTFLNHLGGFEYFFFTAKKEYGVDVEETGETRENILPNWPNSWGLNADTIDKQTFRKSRDYVIVRSQYLSLNQLEALKEIRTSPLVQLMVSRLDRRTVIVDTDSFKRYDEADKVFSVQFKIRFTNLNPSQRV